ncbi:MAG: hypothetical protein CMO66_04370 [Verrucomicrobiales bacterium]|nr:hypothetical protein [Verrucomicrobiales bacterium]|tara:strand:+ start:263 stop:448 length:186 start_codon:yes stop_codon:yes gene_type:complete
MRRTLHIITRPGDPLARMVIDSQAAGEEKEVVELVLHEAGPGTDYDAMLEEIFKADSVQVW